MERAAITVHLPSLLAAIQAMEFPWGVSDGN
jgi:hypothetical protein